ncbi:hypothetical protein F5879DRAFT_987215 [Lentinula edodes]|uniref:Uncharacterized protein n=1 Tax=Lentinula edodes TaxID=5353 RepID=A0A1Q3E6M6_LENED|nr:uncharacterized protein C8R40DRAFT_1170666 [Lentinula edodes]KAH7875036.1 hypothetical protein C8R40DRAFT_1170666 [Lentinula edodes]KAJ3906587.1 hypothetical protein F5879DRAFT_987215 [Lentinula edodes]KAJ3911963.1 hypothetical protein F5877DRAFT_85333 [Lentinula edodes]GAW02806.1 hypothetical protein LENED_004480 [Lentinula edodes]
MSILSLQNALIADSDCIISEEHSITQPITILDSRCLRAPTPHPESSVTEVAHTRIPAIEIDDQNSIPGYLAALNANLDPSFPVDMTVFESFFLPQLDHQSKGKVISILAKAFVDLQSVGSEDVILKPMNRNKGHVQKYMVALVGVGSALLGAVAMFLVLAFF